MNFRGWVARLICWVTGVRVSIMPRGCTYQHTSDGYGVYTFHGTRISGQLLRFMAGDPGKIFRIKERREDGALVVEVLRLSKKPQKKDWIDPLV